MNRNPAIAGSLDDLVDPLGPDEPLDPPADPAPSPTPPSPGDESTRDLNKHSVVTYAQDVTQHIKATTLMYPIAELNSLMTRNRVRVVDPAAVAQRVASAVPPPGLAGMLGRLKSDRLLVMTCPNLGESGGRCGRNTAAQWILSRLTTDHTIPLEDRSVHKLLLDDEEKLLEVLDREEKSTTYFADLVMVDSGTLDETLNDLGNVGRKLEETKSYLVVSYPKEYEDQLRNAVPHRVYSLVPPDGRLVFKAHLSDTFGSEDAERMLAAPTLSATLDKCWPADAVALATQANAARQRGADLATVLRGLNSARTDWSEVLARQLDVDIDAFRRCLLLAAAVLQGADPTAVVFAARQLIKVTKYQLPPVHPLEEASAEHQLSQLEGPVSFDAANVTFDNADFADAVLPHVWRGYRPLRESLKTWLRILPHNASMYTTKDLNRLADSVVQLGVRVDHKVATQIAARWSQSLKPAGDDNAAKRRRRVSIDRTRRSLAVRVLTDCAMDDRVGAKVRAQLWSWVYDRRNPDLLITVAQVCGTGFGVAYPRNALTRLRHIAASQDPVVRDEVVRAIVKIADGVELPTLHRYLNGWLNAERPGQMFVLARAYASVLEALDPGSLGRGLGKVPLLTSATTALWTKAYETMPPTDVAVMVAAWMELAERARPEYGDAMAALLPSAVGSSLRNIGVLSYALRPKLVITEETAPRIDQLRAQIYTQLEELESAV